MSDVPFFSNTPDDTHCFQASLRSVLKYFEPENDFSWEELEIITNKPKGLWSWPMAGLSWMVERGYTVVDIEPFDYRRFVAEGKAYMEELWGKDVVYIQEKHSDIPLAQKDAARFLDTVAVQYKTPDIENIRTYLGEGYLVICMVNARKLLGKDGHVGHSVLVISHDDKGLVVHDPGLPAVEAKHVSYNLFNQAWSDPNDSARNLAALKLNQF